MLAGPRSIDLRTATTVPPGSTAVRSGARARVTLPSVPARIPLAGVAHQNGTVRFGHDPKLHPNVTFFRGRGCDRCRQTGYKGRLGIYELMRINEEIAEMIVRRAPVSELKEAARANGMHTLQEDGFRKTKDGLTTLDEVMRVVFTGGH